MNVRVKLGSASSLLVTLLFASGSVAPASEAAAKRFELTTRSEEAVRLLSELQTRIEHFQFGPENVALAQKLVAADPEFALGQYYLSAVAPPPDNERMLEKAVALAKKASDGERRFIEALEIARANQGQNPEKALDPLEKLAADYPGERLVPTMLAQLYLAVPGQELKSKPAVEKALALYPNSPRLRSLLANEDLLAGRYPQARSRFEAIENDLRKGSAPFSIRYGIAFSYLYEGKPDPAIRALEAYREEYRNAGLNEGFPEVFIWNSIARINLENGRLPQALAAYEKGYESVPSSKLPEDQKQVWLGRLHHGKCRTLAKMGRHDEAWAEAETIRKMIETAGDPAKQYVPMYHYLVGYLMLEKGDGARAVDELKQANATDPFHRLLLGRAYERVGDRANARKAYQDVVNSKANNLERALSYNEAKTKLAAL